MIFYTGILALHLGENVKACQIYSQAMGKEALPGAQDQKARANQADGNVARTHGAKRSYQGVNYPGNRA